MKIEPFFFGKFLLLLLIFLSTGGNFIYSFTNADVREESKNPLENIQALHSSSGALRENPLHDSPDLSKNLFFELSSVDPQEYTVNRLQNSQKVVSYKRDLRTALSIQIFPTHFFL